MSRQPNSKTESRSVGRKSGRRGPAPGNRNRRLTYRVEKLPEAVRGLVDRGLAQGKSFDHIREEVLAAGETISRHALRNYWRNRWRQQNRRLQWANAQSQALAEALRHSGESDEAVLARKMLFSAVLNRMEKAAKEERFLDLLRESREMMKATRHLDAKSPAKTLPSPREIEREVRQIYGWTDEEIEQREAGTGKREA